MPTIQVWGRITSHVHTNPDGSTIVIRAMQYLADQTAEGFFAGKKRLPATEEEVRRIRGLPDVAGRRRQNALRGSKAAAAKWDTMSPEEREIAVERQGMARRGKPASPETKRRISEARKRRWAEMSPEQRAEEFERLNAYLIKARKVKAKLDKDASATLSPSEVARRAKRAKYNRERRARLRG